MGYGSPPRRWRQRYLRRSMTLSSKRPNFRKYQKIVVLKRMQNYDFDRYVLQIYTTPRIDYGENTRKYQRLVEGGPKGKVGWRLEHGY